MNPYILLCAAIISEVFGSSMLKLTNGFKKLLPSIGVIMGYCLSFYLFSISLKKLQLGMAYAIWAGAGTALTALVGIIIYKEKFDNKKMIALILIIGGVTLLNIDGTH